MSDAMLSQAEVLESLQQAKASGIAMKQQAELVAQRTAVLRATDPVSAALQSRQTDRYDPAFPSSVLNPNMISHVIPAILHLIDSTSIGSDLQDADVPCYRTTTFL